MRAASFRILVGVLFTIVYWISGASLTIADCSVDQYPEYCSTYNHANWSWICYRENDTITIQCCATCSKLRIKFEGCEYGDRAPWCQSYINKSEDCNGENLSKCCLTCSRYINSTKYMNATGGGHGSGNQTSGNAPYPETGKPSGVTAGLASTFVVLFVAVLAASLAAILYYRHIHAEEKNEEAARQHNPSGLVTVSTVHRLTLNRHYSTALHDPTKLVHSVPSMEPTTPFYCTISDYYNIENSADGAGTHATDPRFCFDKTVSCESYLSPTYPVDIDAIFTISNSVPQFIENNAQNGGTTKSKTSLNLSVTSLDTNVTEVSSSKTSSDHGTLYERLSSESKGLHRQVIYETLSINLHFNHFISRQDTTSGVEMLF